MNIGNSFIITALAGFSTLIGYFIIYIKGDQNKLISLFLSMAAGVMCTVSIIDLIPSSFSYFSDYFVFFKLLLLFFFFVLGVVISNNISHFANKYDNSTLGRLGVISLISIFLHNVFEGILTFISCQIDLELGISMAFAISLHNIPEGISIAIPLYYANKSKRKIFLMVLVAGFSELIGALMGYLFLNPIINNFTLGGILAITAGIMTNIGLFSLLKESIEYNRKISLFGFLIGIIIMIISIKFI